MDLFTEAFRIVLGVSSGILAAYLAVTTFRAWYSGSDAYEANRAATPRSIVSVLSGQKGRVSHNRNSFGLAVELNSGKLVSQQRLSREAVDDVIGRRI